MGYKYFILLRGGAKSPDLLAIRKLLECSQNYAIFVVWPVEKNGLTSLSMLGVDTLQGPVSIGVETNEHVKVQVF